MKPLEIRFATFKYRIWQAFMYPFRAFKIPKWKREYQLSLNKFSVGDVVLLSKDEPSVKIMASPLVQKKIPLSNLGKADENGFREIKEREQKGTASYSFFELRDPWVIKEVHTFPLSRWLQNNLNGMVIRGAINYVVLEPKDPSSIVFGEKTFLCPPEIIKKIE